MGGVGPPPPPPPPPASFPFPFFHSKFFHHKECFFVLFALSSFLKQEKMKSCLKSSYNALI